MGENSVSGRRHQDWVPGLSCELPGSLCFPCHGTDILFGVLVCLCILTSHWTVSSLKMGPKSYISIIFREQVPNRYLIKSRMVNEELQE